MSSMIVFPGQGSQFVGMGAGLFEKFPELVAIADQILGYSITELCLLDPDQCLNQTQYTQPALFILNVLHYLDSKYYHLSDKPEPVDYIAGHSLGEYAALYAAGAFDFATGLRIVQKRGQLMADAPKGAMAAVVNLDFQQVKQLLADSPFDQLDMANINTDDQIVLSGSHDQVFAAADLFINAGARYIPLKVSAAFHSRLMAPVAQQFAEFLTGIDLAPLTAKVISNLTASVYPATDYVDLLVRQIDHSVKWYESISWALSQGCTDIVEVGPGMVLTKMTFAIKKKPMSISVPVETETALRSDNDNREPVFMFAGQGTHYKNMGRQLYADNPVFRGYFDQCNALVLAQTGLSLLGELFHFRGADEFDDVRISHPVIVCFQYALAQTLISQGVKPVAVIGHSLGEYVAAVVAGAITIEQAISLVVKQADLLTQQSNKGNILVVLHAADIYNSQADDFASVHYGGQNYQNSFILSGETEAMAVCGQKLKNRQINTVKLAVNVAFHSPVIAGVKEAFVAFATQLTYQPLMMPFYSCCLGADSVDNKIDTMSGEHLWQAVSAPVNFTNVIKHYQGQNPVFIDMSATASLSAFIKYEFNQQQPHTYLINQFGHDNESMSRAMTRLGVVRANESAGARI